jgi:hypothetical protein
MRSVLRVLIVLLVSGLVTSAPAHAFTDDDLTDGFYRTVFGSEYRSWGWQAYLVKKFAEPARVYVEDRTANGRRAEVVRFVGSLPDLIDGLKVKLVDDPAKANYRIIVLNRADYRAVVTGEVYGSPSSTFAPGKCIVRVVSSANGIARSDAVIVGDEGDFIFRRCMIEEILQGLGPVNDDRMPAESVFDDDSRAASFTDFDRYIMNMLYHPLLRPGMTKAEARRVLPQVLAEVRARLD